MMQNNVHTWKMTTLSPVHIGDGDELHLNMDFVQGKNRGLDVLDVEAILDQLGSNPKAIQDFGGYSFDFQRFLRDYKLEKQLLYHLGFRGAKPPLSIRRMIKDAFHRPYVPGSSLKGSIRTVLWTQGLQGTSMPSPRDFRAFTRAVSRLGSQSPHEDFLRPLSVSDSAPVNADQALQAEVVKYFNLQTGNKPAWKDFSTRKNVPDHEKAQGVVVEAIKTEQHLLVQTNVLSFLTNQDVRRAANIPACSGLEGPQALCHMINRQALEMVNNELTFFSEFKPATAPAVAFYQNLQQEILKLAQTSNACILRLAWGSGWRGMTGNWMNESTLGQVRQGTRLGREGFPFPKTRRLALKDGYPSVPLGWVRLDLDEHVSADFRKSAEVPEMAVENGQPFFGKSAQKPPKKTAPEPPPGKSAQELRQETIQQFQEILNKESSGLLGKIDFLVEKIEAQDDSKTQQAMCSELVKAAKKLKNFKKAKKAEKAWVVKIQNLAAQHGISM
jgi:CRISPR/Cas system CSM-associated protein Csm5 (group 7 of RAMP superfamily)